VSKFRVCYVIGLFGALGLLLTACGPSGEASSNSAQQVLAYPPLHIQRSSDRIVLTKFEDLCGPFLLAEVKVGGHGAGLWNTPDGKRPPVHTTQEVLKEVLKGGYRIYTSVTFSQFNVLHEHRTTPTTRYLMSGGQVGQDTEVDEDLPTLPGVGGHYLVLFAPPAPNMKVGGPETMIVEYAYPVDTQGIVTVRAAPPEPGPGISDPEIKRSLTEVKQLLATCKA